MFPATTVAGAAQQHVMFHEGHAVAHSADATKATYLLLGLEAGLISEQAAREWAYSEIDSRDDPSIEIIEVAASRSREQLWESLKAIPGEPDRQMAGRQLLALLKVDIPTTYTGLLNVARRAMQVASSSGLPEDVYYSFDQIDDEIFLAVNKKYGTLEWCRQNLAQELEINSRCDASET